MIGDGRPGGNHMFDVIIVFQVRGDGGGNDAPCECPINATGSLDLMPACFMASCTIRALSASMRCLLSELMSSTFAATQMENRACRLCLEW